MPLNENPNKNLITVIAAKLKKDGSCSLKEKPMSDMGGEEDNSMLVKGLAEDLIDAVHAKRPGAVIDAIQGLIEALMDSSDDSEEDYEYNKKDDSPY